MDITPSVQINEPLDVEFYFSTKEWSEMPEHERTRLKNILDSYRMLLSSGFDADKPFFVIEYEKRVDAEEKRNQLLSSETFGVNEGASTSNRFDANKPFFVIEYEKRVDAEEKRNQLLSSETFGVNEGASTSNRFDANKPFFVIEYEKRVDAEEKRNQLLSSETFGVNEGASTSNRKDVEKPLLEAVPKNPRPIKEAPTTLSVTFDTEKYFTEKEWSDMTVSEKADAKAQLEKYCIHTSFKKHVETPSFILAYNKRKDEEDSIPPSAIPRRAQDDSFANLRFYCAGCNTAFLSRHLYEKHEQKCRLKQSLPQLEPNPSLWEDYSADDGFFSCNQCHRLCDDESIMKCHMLEEHCKTTLHICEVCNVELETQSQLQEHVKLHLDDGKWACPKPCGEVFSRKKDLMNHLTDHDKTGSKCFRCNVCYKRYSNRFSLDAHLLKHTHGKRFKCTLCEAGFTQKNSLTRHMKQIHDDGGKKRFECSECSKVYTRRTHLMTHRNSEHTNSLPFRCPVCDKGFSANAHLLHHMRAHSGEKPFSCDICDASFTSKSHLERHMLIHKGERPIACEFCDYRCRQRSDLKGHISRKHKDIN